VANNIRASIQRRCSQVSRGKHMLRHREQPTFALPPATSWSRLQLRQMVRFHVPEHMSESHTNMWVIIALRSHKKATESHIYDFPQCLLFLVRRKCLRLEFRNLFMLPVFCYTINRYDQLSLLLYGDLHICYDTIRAKQHTIVDLKLRQTTNGASQDRTSPSPGCRLV